MRLAFVKTGRMEKSDLVFCFRVATIMMLLVTIAYSSNGPQYCTPGSCPGGERCCVASNGNGVCYDNKTQFCCAAYDSGYVAICNSSQTCCTAGSNVGSEGNQICCDKGTTCCSMMGDDTPGQVACCTATEYCDGGWCSPTPPNNCGRSCDAGCSGECPYCSQPLHGWCQSDPPSQAP